MACPFSLISTPTATIAAPARGIADIPGPERRPARSSFICGALIFINTRAKAWKDTLYNRLHRKHIHSSFDLTEQSMPRLANELNRYRPDVIVAYTKPLYEAGRVFSERNIKPFSPKSIVVGAEKLHDFQARADRAGFSHGL